MVFIGMCTGNVIGPLLYSTGQAPLYRPGLIPFYLMFLNRRHAQRREELGKTAEVGGADAHQQRSLGEDNALQDMTDLRNEYFIFVY